MAHRIMLPKNHYWTKLNSNLRYTARRRTKQSAKRSTTPSTASLYEASKYAIPNEYDKLMAAIGSSGSNAYTWYDQTVYQEDIPSNQIENWAKIQADRFENNVIRGFIRNWKLYTKKKYVSDRDNSKVAGGDLLLSLPQASLWNTNRIGYTGESEEPFHHQYQELL